MKRLFENMKISKKLILGFLFVSFLGIITGVIGIINLNNMVNNQQETYDNSTLGMSIPPKQK